MDKKAPKTLKPAKFKCTMVLCTLLCNASSSHLDCSVVAQILQARVAVGDHPSSVDCRAKLCPQRRQIWELSIPALQSLNTCLT